MGSAAEGEGPAAEGGGEVGEEALPDGGELEPEQQEEGPYGLQWEQVGGRQARLHADVVVDC